MVSAQLENSLATLIFLQERNQESIQSAIQEITPESDVMENKDQSELPCKVKHGLFSDLS